MAPCSELLLSESTPLTVARLPPAVSRCWANFFLPLQLLDADPKAPLTLASVALVWGLKPR